MKGNIFLMLAAFLLLGTAAKAQVTDTLPNRDTIFVTAEVNSPIKFGKGNFRYLYIRNAIPAEIPVKARKIQIISSTAVTLKEEQYSTQGLDIIIPIESFGDERYYTIYIKKGELTIISRRIIIR